MSKPVDARSESIPEQKYGFVVSFSGKDGLSHWSVASHPKFSSRGEALYHAYAVCQKRGFNPQAEGISIVVKQH